MTETHHSDYRRALFVVTAEVSIDADLVADSIRRAQRIVLGRRKNRPPSARTLRIFEHVVNEMTGAGGLPDWGELMASSNRKQPRRGLRCKHVWRFKRDFHRALAAVAFPPIKAIRA